jgi:predicted membrane channel-forming protein YqfA (hemolysin III family)
MVYICISIPVTFLLIELEIVSVELASDLTSTVVAEAAVGILVILCARKELRWLP